MDAEWLLDNFYIIEEQVKMLRRDLNKKSYQQLPVLKSGSLKGQARILAIAVEIVSHTNGQIDEKKINEYLKAYQAHSEILDKELWALPMVIKLALFENIRSLCEEIKSTKRQWQKADRVYTQWKKDEENNRKGALSIFQDSIKELDEIKALNETLARVYG